MRSKIKCPTRTLTQRRFQAIDGLRRPCQLSNGTLLSRTSRAYTHMYTRAPTGCEIKVSHKLTDMISGKADRRIDP